MGLERRSGESEIQYHKRLVYGKLVDKSLADYDYTELAKLIYGKDYSADVARRMIYGSRYTLELLDSDTEGQMDTSMLDELNERKIELAKEKQKFFDQRAAYTKLLRQRARQEELNEILISAIANGDMPDLEYRRAAVIDSDNDLMVSLNDIHFGANVQNYWNTYNSEVCRQMMCRYLDRIFRIAETHDSENCIVWANGDFISGNIHYSIAVTNKENVIRQIMGVSELIADFLAELSKHFRTVTFVSVAGNHSRLSQNKDETLIGERLDDLVEWYLSARLHDHENIIIGGGEKIDDTIYLIDVRGKTYCGVHGDFDGTPSNVQTLQTMAGRPVYAVMSGHKHHNQTDTVQGVKLFMAGSFLGMDEFCIKKRIYSAAEQMVCVCTKDGVVCHYDIPLAES